MALDRTNMVSLLDIGKWLSGSTSNLIMMGDGYNELTEEWGPDFISTKYVNMKTASSTLNGYEFSVTAEREHLSDTMQTKINEAFRKLPTGTAAETQYIRFYKSDIVTGETTATGPAIMIPVTVGPSSTGGSANDPLSSAIEIHGNGDVVQGTITIASDGTYTFAPATEPEEP